MKKLLSRRDAISPVFPESSSLLRNSFMPVG